MSAAWKPTLYKWRKAAWRCRNGLASKFHRGQRAGHARMRVSQEPGRPVAFLHPIPVRKDRNRTFQACGGGVDLLQERRNRHGGGTAVRRERSTVGRGNGSRNAA